jgi:Archaea-specific editing domain of threonyl-tRNA synthetase
MRFLAIHVDYFACRITERGRSKVYEPVADDNRTSELRDGLLILASVEQSDTADPAGVATRAASEIGKLATQLGVRALLLHSFAHLFAELSDPQTAIDVLTAMAAALSEQGCAVQRTPFGWFNTLEIRAKGHPLSRVARIVS